MMYASVGNILYTIHPLYLKGTVYELLQYTVQQYSIQVQVLYRVQLCSTVDDNTVHVQH